MARGGWRQRSHSGAAATFHQRYSLPKFNAPAFCPIEYQAGEPTRFIVLRAASGRQVETASIRETDADLRKTWVRVHRLFVQNGGKPDDLAGPKLHLPPPPRRLRSPYVPYEPPPRPDYGTTAAQFRERFHLGRR
jgi:hypothetical protein